MKEENQFLPCADLMWFGLGQESNVVWSNWDYFIAIFLFAFDRVVRLVCCVTLCCTSQYCL